MWALTSSQTQGLPAPGFADVEGIASTTEPNTSGGIRTNRTY